MPIINIHGRLFRDGSSFLDRRLYFFIRRFLLKINSYNLGMESARLYKSSERSRKFVDSNESNSMWTGSQLSSFSNMLGNKSTEAGKDMESLEDNFINQNPEDAINNALYKLSSRNSNALKLSQSRNLQSEFQKMHQLMIKYIYELLFGGRTKPGENYTDEAMQADSETSSYLVTQNMYQEYSYEESEFTSFTASGLVKTEDGREININMNVSMTRSFSAKFSELISTRTTRVTDPLVINLKDFPANLSDVTFLFDLDADGVKEEIHNLGNGSGFLALDKNGDGIINDGTELFGPNSGNGFSDLAKYDEDGNGWIDENDAIFEALKIWTKDLDGNDILYTLKDQNIGAIYLGSAETNFSLNSILTNETKGYIRETGLFLYEDGNAGTIQHIDLVS